MQIVLVHFGVGMGFHVVLVPKVDIADLTPERGNLRIKVFLY